MKLRRLLGGAAVTCSAVMALGGTAFAHECTNASKNEHAPGAGAQVVFDDNGIVSAKQGFTKRVESGKIDLETGEGFHGLVGFADSEGNVVGTTYIVGPEGEIPLKAQQNGSPDHGIVNICGGTCPEGP